MLCLLQPFEEAAFLAFSHSDGAADRGEMVARHAKLLALAVRSVTLVGKHAPIALSSSQQ